VFSWSGIWRYVVPGLVEEHDVWLIDLPGCGWSDKPHPKKLAPDGYSPAALADRVMQAVASRLEVRRAQGSDPRVYLVGHSLGSTILLWAAMLPNLQERHAQTLDAVDRLVLLCPFDTGVISVPPSFESIIKLKGWQVTIGRAFGLVRKQTRQAVEIGYHHRDRATQEESAMLASIIERPACRRALQAMLLAAVPWDPETGRPDWEEVDRLTALYGMIDKPCLVVWGERDEVLNECMGHKIKDKIPDAQLLELACCGHSSPRECPRKGSEAINAFASDRLSLPARFSSLDR